MTFFTSIYILIGPVNFYYIDKNNKKSRQNEHSDSCIYRPTYLIVSQQEKQRK